jgi:quercetin dioxygenase-like cupin family protein
MKLACAGVVAIALITSASDAASSQASPRPAGTTRTDLQRRDLSIPGWETLQARVDFAPGASFPMHKHPGEEIIYVLEGRLEYDVGSEGPVTLKAGDVVPKGTFHAARTSAQGRKASSRPMLSRRTSR